MESLGVSDIVVIPSNPNIIFIGTGDRDGQRNPPVERGVMKSTDGGLTFSQSNTGMGFVKVNKLILNPQNSNTMIAATDFGIFVSYNQGTNWASKSGNSFDYRDLKYCPGDTTIVYATSFNIGGGANFYRSTNGGSSWTNVNTGMSAASRRCRMEIAVTAHNPNIVYLLSAAPSSRNFVFDSLYKSSDKGATFRGLTPNLKNILGGDIDGNSTSGQGWYDIAMISSPTDSNFLFVGGVNTFKSSNGGTTWTPASSWWGEAGTPFMHADVHYFARSPHNNNIYIGHDGGVAYTNNGASFTDINDSLCITQLYNIGVSQKSKTRFIAGTQDNGTSLSSNTVWKAQIGGDGMHCDISNLDTTKMVASLYYGRFFTTVDNGANWVDRTSLISEANISTSPWVSPMHIHPRVNNIVVAALNNVWISKNIFSGSPSFSSISSLSTSMEATALRFSNSNDSLVFVGWQDGSVRYCSNIFATSPSLTSCGTTFPSASGSEVYDIETSYDNKDLIWVARGNRIYRSANRGTTWTNITANLSSAPYDIPIKSIVVDKNMSEALYVGTAIGVFYKDSAMTNWVPFNTGMPATATITDLEIVYDTVCSSSSVIYAGTYGRSLWKSDLRISTTEPGPNFTLPATSCSGIPVPVTNTTTNHTASTKYKWIITPSAGVTFVSGTNDSSVTPVLQFSTMGTYSIELRAEKPRGGFCRTKKTNIITIGTGGKISHSTTKDTTVCPGDTVIVGITGMTNYTFEPNSFVAKLNDSIYRLFTPSATNYRIVGDISGGCFDTVYVNVKMNPYLAYTVAGNQKFCLGDSTTITVTPSTGTFDTVIWSPMTNLTFNSGPTNVKIKPTTAGIINYTVTMKKATLCNVNFVLPINAQSHPNYDSRINGTFGLKTKTICSGDSVFLSELGVPSNSWAPGIGLNKVTGDTVIAKPLVSTIYYVATSDTTVCPTTIDSLRVNVTPSPTITIIGGKDICIGMKTMMIATGGAPSGSYTWTGDSIKNLSTHFDTIIVNPITSTTYTVTGSNGICSGVAQKIINVGTGTVSLKYEGDTIVCKNTVAQIRVSGADSYHWYPEAAVNNVFKDTVFLYVTDSINLKLVGISIGCTDSIDVPVKIKPVPSIKITADTNSSVCEGTKIKLSMSGGSTYSVYPNYNIKKLTASTFEINPSRTTTYTVVGISSLGCRGQDSIVIPIDTLPVLKITPQVRTIDRGDSIVFTATGASVYSWTPNTYLLTKGDTTNNTLKVKPDSNIIYYLKGKTNTGCSSEGLVIVYVKYGSTSTNSIMGKSLENILIYPNPSSDYVTIESTSNFVITLVDVNGRIVSSFKKDIEQYRLNLSNFSSGNYLMILDDQNGNKNSVKISIEK